MAGVICQWRCEVRGSWQTGGCESHNTLTTTMVVVVTQSAYGQGVQRLSPLADGWGVSQ